jgi:flagellar protein FlaG
MDMISTSVIKPGAYLNSLNPSGEVKPGIKDAEAISKVASVPLPTTNVDETSKELKLAAESAMKDIQHFISSQQRSVRVSKDETSGHMVVQLVDPSSGEVIRTLPSEELLRLARSFEILGNKMVHQVA